MKDLLITTEAFITTLLNKSMAGISIQLKKFLEKRSLIGLVTATAYSAVLSSGNWIIAVVSVFFFSLLTNKFVKEPNTTLIYQIYITYTVAISLILSGPLQLMFTRYVADRLFEKQIDRVLPNYFGALAICMGYSFVISLFISFYFFESLPFYYHIIFSFTISTLSGVWLSNALLSGLKSYRYIIFSFCFCYLLIGVLLFFTSRFGIIWTFISFYTGQVLLLFLLVTRIILDYSTDRLFEFDFLSKRKSYYSLGVAGFFYNLGIWSDKFIFWFNPFTGNQVFGNLRTSVLYDIPIILAYISLIPGIAIFFMKVEIEFAESYDNYYRAVRDWGRLDDLYRLGNKMIENVRTTFYDTLRVQGIWSVLIFFFEEKIFYFLKLPSLYIPLFNILLTGALLQLSFMVVFAFLSYFDKRRQIALISIIFCTGNIILSILTQFLGPYYYGYGFALSLLIATTTGILFLRRFLDDIHYRTFVSIV
ncbi:exopolysaccharide Pel transporter PelG [Thermodesulfovibrio aggregans]|nr:exopolysaccharide Pel transporter PelG [Thermodesulfovibrio aggregans]